MTEHTTRRLHVDVVIPLYNGAAFIDRALRSVLDQRVDADVTVTVVDDASTDDGVAHVEAVARDDARVRIIHLASNAGVSVARNTGIRATDSDAIAFIDQDDEWLEGKLRDQVAALEADPQLGYVVGLQRFELADGHALPQWCRREWLDAPQAGYLPSALLVRRTVIESIGAFDEALRTGGDDTDWFARARRLSVPARALDRAVVIRHVHGDNLSASRRTSDELLALVRRHMGDRTVPE